MDNESPVPSHTVLSLHWQTLTASFFMTEQPLSMGYARGRSESAAQNQLKNSPADSLIQRELSRLQEKSVCIISISETDELLPG